MRIYKGSVSLFTTLVWTNEITVFVATKSKGIQVRVVNNMQSLHAHGVKIKKSV